MRRLFALLALCLLPTVASAQSAANCKSITTSWTNLPIGTAGKGSVQRGDTLWLWQKQTDSVTTRCVLTSTTMPPPPPPVGTVPPRDTVGALVWSEGFNGSRGTWDDDGLTSAAVVDTAMRGEGSGSLRVTIPSGGTGGWLLKFVPGITGGMRASFLYRTDRTITTMRLARLTGARTDNLWSSAGNASTCPTGTNFFSATFEFVAGNLGFYSQYVGMPGQPASCWSVNGSSQGATFPAPRTVSANAWHRIILEVIPNSPAASDGSQRIWIDGVLVAQWTGIRWRTDAVLGMNGFELDPYISGGGGPITVWYDDLQVRSVGGPVTPPPPPPPPPPPDTTGTGGPFAAPDIHTVTFDAPGDDAKFTALGVRFPASWHVADATGGRNGSRAMRVNLSAGPLFEPVGLRFTPRSRVFYRWYFRTQGTPSGNVKGMIVRDRNEANKIGDFYGGSPCWSFDQEGEAICFGIGLSYTQATANGPALADGNWHSIEVDYNRNAGSNVEARIWVDGRAVVLTPGPAMWGTQPYPAVQYVGGDRATNTPTTIRTARSADSQIGSLTFWETISQGSTATVWVDDIAVSSQRIGP